MPIIWLAASVGVSSPQEHSGNDLALHFPEGVHDVSSSVLSKPRVVISGDSEKMSIVRCSKQEFKNWQDYFIFGFGKGVKHIEFRNLIFEVSNRETSVVAILPDIDPDATLAFEDCVFRFTGEADPVPDQSDELKAPCAITVGARLKQCRFVRCTTSNMMLMNTVRRAGYADTILARECRFESPHGHLRMKHGNLVADGCTFTGSQKQEGLDLYVSRAQITKCVFSDDAASIRLSDVAPAVLMGCRFQGKAKRPVLVERRSHVLIVDSAMGEGQRLFCERKYGNAVALNCDLRRETPSWKNAQLQREDLRLITAADPGSAGKEEDTPFARLLNLAEALPEILYVDRIRSLLARKLVAHYNEEGWERLCRLGVNGGTVDEWLLLVEEILDKDPECAKKLISRNVARLLAQKLHLPVFQNHLFPGLLTMMRGRDLGDWRESLLAQEALPVGYRDQIESIMISNCEGDHGYDQWGTWDRIGPWTHNAVFRRLKESNDLPKLRALAERFPDSPVARRISAHIFQQDYTPDDLTREELRELRRETLDHRYAVCAVGRFGNDQLRKLSDFYGTKDVFAFRRIGDLAKESGALKQAYAESPWDVLWVVLPCAEMSERTHDFFRDLARSMDPDLFLDFVPAYLPCAHGRDLSEFLENLIRAEGAPFKDHFSASYVQGMTYDGYPDPVCADLDHPVCRLSAVLNPTPLAGSSWWCGTVLSSIRDRDALLLIDHGDASGGDALNIRTFRDLPEGALQGSLVVSSYCHGAGMLNPIERVAMGWRDAHGFSHACLKKGAIAFYGGLSFNFGPYATTVFTHCFYGGGTILEGYRAAMDSDVLFLGDEYGRSCKRSTLSLYNIVCGDPGRRITLPHGAETLNYSCDSAGIRLLLFPSSSAFPGTGLPNWPTRGFNHTIGYNHVMASVGRRKGQEKYQGASAFRVRLPMEAIPAPMRKRGLKNLTVERDPSVADDLDVLGYKVLEESDGEAKYAQFLFLVKVQWRPSLVVDGVRLSLK